MKKRKKWRSYRFNWIATTERKYYRSTM